MGSWLKEDANLDSRLKNIRYPETKKIVPVSGKVQVWNEAHLVVEFDVPTT